MRASEICELKLSSFSQPYMDHKLEIVDILVEGKGQKQRVISILYHHIKKELNYFLPKRPNYEILLKQIRGNNLTRHSLYRYFQEIHK